jgi:hypothetical protein
MQITTSRYVTNLLKVQQVKYLGTVLKNKKCTHEELESRLKFGNNCSFGPEYFIFTFAFQKYEV